MALFKKGDVWYIDCYVDSKRKREAVGPIRWPAESVLAKRKVQVAENNFLDMVGRPKTFFEELTRTCIKYAETNKLSRIRDENSIKMLSLSFGGRRLEQMTPLIKETPWIC